MPIYEYRCDVCGDELETIQKISEAPLTHCPACGSEGLRKKISAAVFRLKGGGWYETDFKSDKKKNVASDDSGGGKQSDDGANAQKGDAKSDSASGQSEKSGDSGGKTKEKPASTAKSAASTTGKKE